MVKIVEVLPKTIPNELQVSSFQGRHIEKISTASTLKTLAICSLALVIFTSLFTVAFAQNETRRCRDLDMIPNTTYALVQTSANLRFNEDGWQTNSDQPLITYTMDQVKLFCAPLFEKLSDFCNSTTGVILDLSKEKCTSVDQLRSDVSNTILNIFRSYFGHYYRYDNQFSDRMDASFSYANNYGIGRGWMDPRKPFNSDVPDRVYQGFGRLQMICKYAPSENTPAPPPITDSFASQRNNLATMLFLALFA